MCVFFSPSDLFVCPPLTSISVDHGLVSPPFTMSEERLRFHLRASNPEGADSFWTLFWWSTLRTVASDRSFALEPSSEQTEVAMMLPVLPGILLPFLSDPVSAYEMYVRSSSMHTSLQSSVCTCDFSRICYRMDYLLRSLPSSGGVRCRRRRPVGL